METQGLVALGATLVCFSAAVMKHPHQKNTATKDLLDLHFQFMICHQERSKQEPKAGTWSR